MPQARAGAAYDVTVVTQGGAPPLAWRLTGGALPPGLQLSAAGEVSGTPAGASQKSYAFTLTVSDSSKPAQSAAMQFSLLVQVAPLRITGISQKGAGLKIVGASANADPPDPPQNAAPPATSATLPPAPAAGATNQGGTTANTPPTGAAVQPASNPCASLKSLPGILGTLVNGQTSFSGCMESGMSAAEISVIVAGVTAQCSSTVASDFAQRPSPFPAAQGASGVFTEFGAQIAALKTGQQVCLTELNAAGAPAKIMANAVVVAAPPTTAAPTCASTSAAYFPVPPTIGLKVVSGCAGPAPQARVVVYDENKVNLCPATFPDLSQPTPAGVEDDVPANVDTSTGVFHAELHDKLGDAKLICAYSVAADQHPPVVSTKWSYDDPESPMGRTHYYLSTGIELSEDNQQFSNQDIYLGFLLDRNWLRGSPTARFTGLLNSEFSAQLTSIPVAATGSTSTPSTSATQSVGTFISSQKAAVVGGAVYMPLYTNAFKGWFGTQTTAFVGPIVKGGLQTITSGALSASAPVPGTTTTTTTVNSGGLYYFWGAGLRLGDLRLHRSWNVAPEMLSHLDLTVGQWENFKQCRQPNSRMCAPDSTGTFPAGQLYQPLLFALEGQINVPKTPVEIGFKSITPLQGGGKGDLRFFFGVKLDVGCIYKSFKGGSAPSFFQCTDDQPSSTTAAAASATTGGASPAAPKATGTTATQSNP
ncbi:MAG: putative Ig domain-containing protein [Candidatus Acidiferrales bacterium]